MTKDRQVQETVAWAMQEQDRRATERGIAKGGLAELALIYEVGGDILRRPRPTLWQRVLAIFR